MDIAMLVMGAEPGTMFWVSRDDGTTEAMDKEGLMALKDEILESVGACCIDGQAYIKVNII